MIRVIYRWRVSETNFASFQAVWTRTTNQIHETVPGALGSFMLRDTEDKTAVMTVAKWDARESWEAFWGAENPAQMTRMRELGERLSVQVCEEIDDFTR
ncbi:antibiotic biosynthesis monooxygenase family protein [Salinicola avicenniae]|uniref:antibiotic biosynthesis monooxygenase family protein n=1 Tax=Salinicola avicenniae TaxID=2916836 RepID=UPI0020737085|nr:MULTISPECIES: antibiotic biosynthesis monooxygenase [unclassified Salinicola]